MECARAQKNWEFRRYKVVNPVAESVLKEARWYRQIGRGRVFLQSML